MAIYNYKQFNLFRNRPKGKFRIGDGHVEPTGPSHRAQADPTPSSSHPAQSCLPTLPDAPSTSPRMGPRIKAYRHGCNTRAPPNTTRVLGDSRFHASRSAALIQAQVSAPGAPRISSSNADERALSRHHQPTGAAGSPRSGRSLGQVRRVPGLGRNYKAPTNILSSPQPTASPVCPYPVTSSHSTRSRTSGLLPPSQTISQALPPQARILGGGNWHTDPQHSTQARATLVRVRLDHGSPDSSAYAKRKNAPCLNPITRNDSPSPGSVDELRATPSNPNNAPLPLGLANSDHMSNYRVDESGSTFTSMAVQAQGMVPIPAPQPRTLLLGASLSEVPKLAVAKDAHSACGYLDGFRRVLGFASGAFGPLGVVLDELIGFITMHEEAARARKDIVLLKNELKELLDTLRVHFSDDTPPIVTEGINNLCSAIDNELQEISVKGRGSAEKWRQEGTADLDDIVRCYRRIHGHLKRLQLNVNLKLWKTVDEQSSENRLKSLAPSMSARYNSAEAHNLGRRECTPETRRQVLKGLSHWVYDNEQDNMYWMSGMAGTGKTTIASSLCAMLEQCHGLGASFFCTRVLPNCREVNLILPTIAYQLARYSRPFYHSLCRALQADPDLHTKALPNQLQGLIIDPLREVAAALPEHLVIVFDALDECKNGEEVGLFLELLARNVRDLPLKIFVSSRPEPQIRSRIGDTKSKLILHDLEASIVQDDIRLYLRTELRALSVTIGDTDLTTLVKRAGVLFIYAATAVRYIKTASSRSQRQERVKKVLDQSGSSCAKTNNDIDGLYGLILTSVFGNSGLDEEDIEATKFVLDTVVCAQEPLTIGSLAGLIGIDDASLVRNALDPLWSVLHIYGDEEFVTTLHASFPEYMLDDRRSKDNWCHATEHHGWLAEICFDRIKNNEPQFNICGIESSYLLDEEIRGLDDRVKLAIPQDFWYACRYWAIHLKLGGPSTKRLQKIHDFMENGLLLWMEVLNLKKQMSVSSSIFEVAGSWCKEANAPQKTKDLVHDAWRFATMFSTNDVSRSTAHLYTSMLAVWPKSEALAECYLGRRKGLVRVGGTGITRRQLELLGVWKTNDPIRAIAFSVDGTRFASGSSDGAIRVWDAHTGKLQLGPLKGHKHSVRSVAFSTDGTRIVSSSSDSTINLWDARNGEPVFSPNSTRQVLSLLNPFDPFKGHISPVNSVAFSPNGKRIVSGSDDKTIRLWCTTTGREVARMLEEQPSPVKSVAFSPDGGRIASGSNGCIIGVWDANNGEKLLLPFTGHSGPVKSIAFSPDGTRIVSGSDDGTVRVWDSWKGTQLFEALKGHSSWVKSVSFSPDGMRIVSGSADGTIRLWDPHSGKRLLDPLKGHTSPVESVAFSPDSMRIMSGSYDMTIRVWDPQTSKSPKQLEGHTNSVESVAFSHDGLCIASGSNDKTIRVWNANTGKPLLAPLNGHTGSVRSVAFSPDGGRIVSGSNDNTIRVWKVQTGKHQLGPLTGHTDFINSVAFSPDGMRIVSGSDDNTVRIWDSQTGELQLGPLKGHTKWVKSAKFAPDGMRVVSGACDRTVRVWDAWNGKLLIAPLKGHTNWVRSVAFSSDGMRIASGSDDRTIRVWNTQTGRLLLDPLMGHTDAVNAVTFSPNGRLIISGSRDHTIRVWDSQTGVLLLDPLKGHTSRVKSIAFSPGGSRIVSGSFDTTVRVWKLKGGESVLKASHSQSNQWKINEHGWVIDSNQRRLIWLPPDLRDRVVLPNMIHLISSEGSVTLDFKDARLGESWSR